MLAEHHDPRSQMGEYRDDKQLGFSIAYRFLFAKRTWWFRSDEDISKSSLR